MTAAADPARRIGRAGGNDAVDVFFRFVAWGNLYVLAVFLAVTWLVMLGRLPGPGDVFRGGAPTLSWALALLFPAALLLAFLHVKRTPLIGLREDSDRITAFNAWLIRGAFFAVFYVGLADAVISFLRVEEMLPGLVGEDLAGQLGRALFRGPWVHLPLVVAGMVTALFTRTLGFSWLALLIVAAELLIVISRFIFSYEQAFMGDLVRFWYAALFLFASAYTLLEEGHVRVDVVYAAMPPRVKGVVNAVGAVLLGMSLCWVILAMGMGSRSSIIMAPLLSFEVTQTGFGMYVKYLMAGFLGIFAISMLIQFAAALLDAVADARGDPGARVRDEEISH